MNIDKRAKLQRKQWWASLSDEEKHRYTSKYEHRGQTNDYPEIVITEKQKKDIVRRLVKIGMEENIIPSWRHFKEEL